MNIRTIPITEINRAPYNPRKTLKPGDPAYDKLKKAVDTFGLVEPLVWNKRSGQLCGGHQRLTILEERGETKVEVSVVDLDETQEKALNLALNRQSGEWDFASLSDMLAELDAGGLDMELTGFGVDELAKLMTWTADPSTVSDGAAISAVMVAATLKIPAKIWLMMQDEVKATIEKACLEFGLGVEWPKS